MFCVSVRAHGLALKAHMCIDAVPCLYCCVYVYHQQLYHQSNLLYVGWAPQQDKQCDRHLSITSSCGYAYL